jgi:hypothetical protein
MHANFPISKVSFSLSDKLVEGISAPDIDESDAYAQGSHTYQHPVESTKRTPTSAKPAATSSVGSWDDFMLISTEN